MLWGMYGDIRDNILATLAYFDVFDYPLTAEEIQRGLIRLDLRTVFLDEFDSALSRLTDDGLVFNAHGFYFLFGRQFLVPLRRERARQAQRLIRRAQSVARLFALWPFVRAVFVSGSLAFENTSELSDIDVLIIVRDGRLWLTRFVLHGILFVAGVRRHRGHGIIAPGKICLNHFVSDRDLIIPMKSLYNAQTYQHLKLLFSDDADVVRKFYKSNKWLANFLVAPVADNRPLFVLNIFIKVARSFLNLIFAGRLGDWCERKVGRYQTRRIRAGGIEDGVILSPTMLAFHPHSIERDVLSGYRNRLHKFDIQA